MYTSNERAGDRQHQTMYFRPIHANASFPFGRRVCLCSPPSCRGAATGPRQRDTIGAGDLPHGVRDAIAFSRSVDGGSTWSTPMPINAVAATQALLPAVSVRADGMVGVLYYDFRNDTGDASTLLCDVWLATSANGSDWVERHVAGPFDMRRAPVTPGGLFVGDYQALTSASGRFMAFFTQAGPDAASPADIWASVLRDGTATAFE